MTTTMTTTNTAPTLQFIKANAAAGINIRFNGGYYTRNLMMRVIMKAAHALVAATKNTAWPVTFAQALRQAFIALREAKARFAKEAAKIARAAAEQAAREAAAAQPTVAATRNAEVAAAEAKSSSLRELVANVADTEGYQNWVRRNRRRSF